MSEDGGGAKIVEVLAPVAVNQTYSYLAPPALSLVPGDHVKIPLGTREAYGVVWETRDHTGGASNLKSVAARYDRPPLSKNLRDSRNWMSSPA